MRLSDLLGLQVVDQEGRKLGRVKDVRFRQSDPVVPLTGRSGWTLTGLVVGGSGFAQRLGFLHGDVAGPALLKHVVRWVGRKGYFVPWDRIAEIDGTVNVRGSGRELDHPHDAGGEA